MRDLNGNIKFIEGDFQIKCTFINMLLCNSNIHYGFFDHCHIGDPGIPKSDFDMDKIKSRLEALIVMDELVPWSYLNL